MAALNTTMLELPGTELGILRDTAIQEGILGTLSPEAPTIFGPVTGATFSGVPKATIVGESEAKPEGDNYSLAPWKAEPIKLVTQQRVSDEFMWADDDYKLGVIRDLIVPGLGASIGRGVDLIAFHGINPKTGQLAPTKAPKYLAQATKVVVSDGAPTKELNEAVGLIVKGGTMPTGVAMDAAYNYDLATEVYPEGHSLAGQPMYPQMGFNGLDNWRGLNVSQSSTVSGSPEISGGSGIKAIVGDWGHIRWGFQRNFPMEVIEFGDPDNTGRDLKGHNEVMLRTEAVIYVAVGDLDKFALVKGTGA